MLASTSASTKICNHLSFQSIPDEMILSILKKVEDWVDVFEMRKVSKKMRNIIDTNLKYFYAFYQNKYPDSFMAQLKYENIYLKDFNRSFKMKYIIDFSRDNYSSQFVKKLMDKSPSRLRLSASLYKEYNVGGFFAMEFIDKIESRHQFNRFLKLKKCGFTDFICKSISLESDSVINEDRIQLMCELKGIGFNDFYCKQAGLSYTMDDLEMLKKIYNICKREHFAIEMYEVMKQLDN